MQTSGMIFDAQRFSLHDGPGLRTCLFFKGCGLRCDWCSNPESQRLVPELAVFVDQCFGCGDCLPVCGPGALKLEENKLRWQQPLCDGCGECLPVCPANAMRSIGEEIQPASALARVMRDAAFYNQGGGLTLTGGEPALQPAFAEVVLRLAREEGLDTAIETCGHAPWTNFERLLPFLDRVLLDVKHMDSERHKQATGAGNELILENARRLAASGVETVIRVPLIPGFNATGEDLSAIADFVKGLGTVSEVHLLPFHTLGRGKYRALGREYPMGDVPPMKPEEAAPFAGLFRDLNVVVGG